MITRFMPNATASHESSLLMEFIFFSSGTSASPSTLFLLSFIAPSSVLSIPENEVTCIWADGSRPRSSLCMPSAGTRCTVASVRKRIHKRFNWRIQKEHWVHWTNSRCRMHHGFESPGRAAIFHRMPVPHTWKAASTNDQRM